MNIHCIVKSSLIVAFALSVVGNCPDKLLAQLATWNNPGVGIAAGNWSTAANWTPAIVPGPTSTASINNGGEAVITSSVAVSRIEVGRNNGIGSVSSTTAGITISTNSDFDLGEIGGTFAVGQTRGRPGTAQTFDALRQGLGRTALTESESKRLIAAWGVPVSREERVASADAAAAAAERIGFPVALKVESPDILHKTEAGIVRLGLTNLRVPRLEFAYQTRTWDFELLFDVHLAFPALDSLVLPPIADVSLVPTGFRVPAFSIPELAAADFGLSGFIVRPLAFRSAAFAFNWFTGETPSDPGLAFDLEVAFPSTAPAELRDTRLSVLDAGYVNGAIIPVDGGMNRQCVLNRCRSNQMVRIRKWHRRFLLRLPARKV